MNIMFDTIMNNVSTLLFAVPLSAIGIFYLKKMIDDSFKVFIYVVIGLIAIMPSVTIPTIIIGIMNGVEFNLSSYSYYLIYGFLEGIKLSSWIIILYFARGLARIKSPDVKYYKYNKKIVIFILVIILIAGFSGMATADFDVGRTLVNTKINFADHSFDTYIIIYEMVNDNTHLFGGEWLIRYAIELGTLCIGLLLCYLLLEVARPTHIIYQET